MTRIAAQARKELTQLARDRMALALVLALPVFQLLLMGQSISMVVHNLPIVVQDLDDSPASRQLIDAFRGSRTFQIQSWPSDRRPEEAFTSNYARGALIIPSHFDRDLTRGLDATVQLLVDGSDSNTSQLLAGYASGVAQSFNANRATAAVAGGPIVRTALRFWYNPGLSSKRFYGPGIFVMGLSMFPPLLATLAMAREGERKTILQVYVSNISAFEFILGKVLAFMAVALTVSMVMLAVLFAFFGVEWSGDPTPFLAGTVLYAFCVASFGILIGAAIPNQAAAMQAVMFGGFLLVFMLSGMMFPLSNIPSGLRWLSNLVWSRYYIEIVRDVFLQGGGWPAVWHKVAAIALSGAIFFGLAWRRMWRMQLEV
jgi:ABC-2 type transport system permease protein